jgi:xylan 1,4-beta-xylosidase
VSRQVSDAGAIDNPVLPGSNPDPSLLRVGDDYYLATSTFQWFPGIRLHHSRDLSRWRLVGHVIDRPGPIDLSAVPDSGGIWAPNLTHHQGRFHVVFTCVHARGVFPLVAASTWLVSAARIEGPWSDPVFLHGRGWDPALFHDGDGRSWLLGMALDPRPGHTPARGITIQPCDVDARTLRGTPRVIFSGTALGCTEAPQLFVRAGLHYLITAEGGTSWQHAVTVARSRHLFGPYEADPEGPMLTSRSLPAAPLQKTGHGSVVQAPQGEWFMAFLGTRPLAPGCSSPLGRETSIAKLRWTPAGWPRLDPAGCVARLQVTAPVASPARPTAPPTHDRAAFVGATAALGPEWNTLRMPADRAWCQLRPEAGGLHLRGGAPLIAAHASCVARRLSRLGVVLQTRVRFAPTASDHAAGLVLYHDTQDSLFACVTFDDALGACVAVIHTEGGRYATFVTAAPVTAAEPIVLQAAITHTTVRFFWSRPEEAGRPLGPTFDLAVLADDHRGKDSFTGAFVGMAVVDPDRRRWAQFDHFDERVVTSDDGNRAETCMDDR